MTHCYFEYGKKCKRTGKKCIIKRKVKSSDYYKCKDRRMVKDFDEMDRAEKAYIISVENKKVLSSLTRKIKKAKKEIDSLTQEIKKLTKEFDNIDSVFNAAYTAIDYRINNIEDDINIGLLEKFKRLINKK